MIDCTRSTCIVFLFAVAAGITTRSHAFSINSSHGGGNQKIPNNNWFQQRNTAVMSVPRTTLFAGFGNTSAAGFHNQNNSSSKRNKKKKKSASASSPSASLKPKSQWDRFMALKQSTAVKVGVRVVVTEDSSSSSAKQGEEGTWMDVGRVRAQDDTLDGQIASLVVQRGLVAEHAKRLYPLLISSKDKVEWGFQSNNNNNNNENDNDTNKWVAVNVKDVNVDAVDVKKIGFEGRPDPASGYYCHYDVSSKGTKVLNLENEKDEPN